jgi:hypothetical protein
MTSALGSVASLAARAGGAVMRQVRSAIERGNSGTAGATSGPASGWLVVSIDRQPTEIDATSLPTPCRTGAVAVSVRMGEVAPRRSTPCRRYGAHAEEEDRWS